MTTEVIRGTANENPRAMMQLALDKGADTKVIEKLMDLQERWDAMQAKKAYVAAMAAFKRECPPVLGKDKQVDVTLKSGGHMKFRHATIGGIMAIVTPLLSKNGLHLAWETKQAENLVTVTCTITHEDGHRESTTLSGPRDESGGKNPIQTVGSSVTYLQRYTLVCALGLATADQDDADDQDDSRPPVSMPKAKDSPPADQPSEPAADRPPIPSVAGKVERIAKKGKRGGIMVGGEWFNTFDTAFVDAAETAKASGEQVKIQYAVNQWAPGKTENKILTLDVLHDAPAEPLPPEPQGEPEHEEQQGMPF